MSTKHQIKHALERIAASIDVSPDGCWLWRFGTTHGHARISIAGRRVYVHRLMCELVHGPIAHGLMACHHCDVARCVNPAHLYVGTHADNTRDAVDRGRTTRGRRLSDEHRLKVSRSLLGRRQPIETRRRIAAGVRAYFAHKAALLAMAAADGRGVEKALEASS